MKETTEAAAAGCVVPHKCDPHGSTVTSQNTKRTTECEKQLE